MIAHVFGIIHQRDIALLLGRRACKEVRHITAFVAVCLVCGFGLAVLILDLFTLELPEAVTGNQNIPANGVSPPQMSSNDVPEPKIPENSNLRTRILLL